MKPGHNQESNRKQQARTLDGPSTRSSCQSPANPEQKRKGIVGHDCDDDLQNRIQVEKVVMLQVVRVAKKKGALGLDTAILLM